MRKLLLTTTALVGIVIAEPGEAAPVGAWVATAAFGLSAGTVGFAVVSGVVSMAISVGISAIASKLRGKPKQEAVRAELQRPTSLPAYRFVYGRTSAPGTPVGWRVVGRVLYICYLLNSRPSAGPFTVLFDKREVEKTGDEFDFSAGGGAGAVNEPFVASRSMSSILGHSHVRYWIGDGTQTECPAGMVEGSKTLFEQIQGLDGYFTATDAWRGRTVLWAAIHCGGDEERQERWPANPPELSVEGNWSIVLDPRDGQEKFSRNQALITLDALRNNPVRPYADTYLRLDTFGWAADVAGQQIEVKEGGTIPRYLCDGVLVFEDGGEIEDQLQPLLDAGAARFSRIGGRLALVPAVARPSIKVITDATDGQPIDLVRWKSSDELYTEAVARFVAPDRAYESAETPTYIVPGAQEADGGEAKRLKIDLDFVQDHRQAQRIAKIMVMRSRMQKRVSAELFPDCFDLVSGSVCDVDLGFPYGTWQGQYEVESIAPAAGINDDQSITIRLPTVLTETSDAIYAWDAVNEEKDMLAVDFDGSRDRIQPPANIVLSTGNDAATQAGDTIVPGIIAAWNETESASVTSYEYQWFRRNVSTLVNHPDLTGAIPAEAVDPSGVYIVRFEWPRINGEWEYLIRVRAVGSYGASEWVASALILPEGPSAIIASPQEIAATAVNSGRIDISVTQSASPDARTLLIYGNDVDNPLTAVELWQVAAGASVSVNRSETGLAANTTRYYFARARDQWGNLSDFTGSASATTTA